MSPLIICYFLTFCIKIKRKEKRKKGEKKEKMPTDAVNKKTNRLVYVLSLLSLFFTFNMMDSNIV
ncbi:hypothetical protein ACEW7V_01360 [Areca yellow leaf disease phytoplasma]|uniref:hypothetical protein n=1 Tax=Areca yellow leaf disease phytoplasma TaxID=927614 RepID=UPI0035B50C6A